MVKVDRFDIERRLGSVCSAVFRNMLIYPPFNTMTKKRIAILTEIYSMSPAEAEELGNLYGTSKDRLYPDLQALVDMGYLEVIEPEVRRSTQSGYNDGRFVSYAITEAGQQIIDNGLFKGVSL